MNKVYYIVCKKFIWLDEKQTFDQVLKEYFTEMSEGIYSGKYIEKDMITYGSPVDLEEIRDNWVVQEGFAQLEMFCYANTLDFNQALLLFDQANTEHTLKDEYFYIETVLNEQQGQEYDLLKRYRQT